MKTYSKIDTLFVRDEKFNVTDTLRNPVIGTINKWIVTEKIDGTNIRITITAEDEVKIGGRTDSAQIPADLCQYLYTTFTKEKMASLRLGEEKDEITLYGEGYGAGIQKGGGDYRADKGFILFDVQVNDKYWLTDEAVTEKAVKLGIQRVPILGEMSLQEIIELVKVGFNSKISIKERKAEGIVARPIMPLYDQQGNRLIIKLKTIDYQHK